MSHGERGGSPQLRREEAEEAARVLGSSLHAMPFPDTLLAVAQMVPVIESEIAAFKPDVVATMSVHDSHQDHRAVHEATVAATRDFVGTVLAYMTPSAAERFRPNWFVPLSADVFATKLTALECHRSQRARVYLSAAYLEATGRYWAMVTRSSAPYVEPFELLRHKDAQ